MRRLEEKKRRRTEREQARRAAQAEAGGEAGEEGGEGGDGDGDGGEEEAEEEAVTEEEEEEAEEDVVDVGDRVRVKGKGYGVVTREQRGGWLSVQLDGAEESIKARSTAVFAAQEGEGAEEALAGREAGGSGGRVKVEDEVIVQATS